MYSKELEELMDSVIADGEISDKERAVLHKRALAEGVDPDEMDVVIDGRLAKMLKAGNPAPQAPAPAHKSQKMGDVMKCPSCGAQVVSGLAICPECGFAFKNVDLNHSAQALQQRLKDLEQEYAVKIENAKAEKKKNFLGFLSFSALDLEHELNEKKSEAISTFLVPNSRIDLMELLSMTQRLGSPHGSQYGGRDNFKLAYWQLYCSCVNKARFSFADDPAFQHFYEYYDKHKDEERNFWDD